MNYLNLLHFIVILLVLIPPFLFSNCRILFIYLVYVLLIVIHWKFNDNQCILTNLEEENDEESQEEEFILKHLKSMGLGKLTEFKNLSEIVTLFLILFALIRLYWNIKEI